MAELFRSFVGRLNDSVKGFMKPSRKKCRLPISIKIVPNIHTTGGAKNFAGIGGETFDLSSGGLSFIVSSIRVGQHYLVTEGTRLEIAIETPHGTLSLQAAGCRYEQIDIDSSVSKFLVGARILNIGPADKALLETVLNDKNSAAFGKMALGLEMPKN